MSSLESSFSIENLNRIVDSFVDGHFDYIDERPRISTGADRIDFEQFSRDRAIHLAAINRRVLRGTYIFAPFLEVEIPKPGSGEKRTISIAAIRDNVVQRALYEYLYGTVDAELSPSVFGYRRGLSAHDAVRKIRRHFAAGRVFVFDADIRKFFDTVDHEVLLKKVKKLRLDDRANVLIRRFLKTGRVPAAQVAEHKTAGGRQRKFEPEARVVGVPQGGILSGLLSNLYLAGFDRRIRRYHEGLIRYADDFVVCCESEKDCARVHKLCIKALEPLKIGLHPDKTHICTLGKKGVDFLGFRISDRSVRIRGRNVAAFKARIKGVIASQKDKGDRNATLRSLLWRITFKVRGPNKEQIRKMAERGKRVSLGRRSWVGYFRIVDDLRQIKSLDRWLRRQISKYMADQHHLRVSLKAMQERGLPSLVNILWKARSKARPSEG